MPVTYKDYYAVLGIDRNATQDDVRKAYRNLAKKYHPDVNKSPGSEERYKEINEAYEVLKDPDKRQRYDTLGNQWREGQTFTPPPEWGQGGTFRMDFGEGGGSDFSEFFKTIFGGFGGVQGGAEDFFFRGAPRRRKGEDIEVQMELTLSDVICRDSKTISLERYEIGADGRRILELRPLLSTSSGYYRRQPDTPPGKGAGNGRGAKWRSLYNDKAEKGSTLSCGSI